MLNSLKTISLPRSLNPTFAIDLFYSKIYLISECSAVKIRFSLLLIGFLPLFFACVHTPPEQPAERHFNFRQDTFGFSNETVWTYDAQGNPSSQRDHSKAKGEHYSRRCFVVSRGAVQFWKFARFEPKAPPLSEILLAKRIRELAHIDVWKKPLPQEKRIIFPGYANLRAISSAHPKVFQENMGLGWPVYCRLANMPMILPPTRAGQADLYQQILTDLKWGYPTIAWLVDFPKLKINHAVTIYALENRTEKQTIFLVYDPNDHLTPKRLFYDHEQKTFSFQKTFYYKGGELDLRPLYRSPFQ